MNISNRQHLIHRTIDIGTGFLLSILIQWTVFPLFDIHIDILDNIALALIFMVFGIARSFIFSKFIFKYKK